MLVASYVKSHVATTAKALRVYVGSVSQQGCVIGMACGSVGAAPATCYIR